MYHWWRFELRSRQWGAAVLIAQVPVSPLILLAYPHHKCVITRRFMGALSYYENKPLPEIGILALFYLFYFYNLYPILCIFHMFGGLFQALWNDQHLTSISRRGCDEREDSVALSWPVHIAGCENLRSLQEGVKGQGSWWEERVETETLRPLLHPFHSANAKPHPFVRAGIQKRLET